MAKFDAATAVESLEFDLSRYEGPVGTIPEPTQDQIDRFFQTITEIAQALQVQVGPNGKPDLGALGQVLEKMGDEAQTQMKQFNDRMIIAVSEVCSGVPTPEQINALPYRVKNAFIGWITESLRPEA